MNNSLIQNEKKIVKKIDNNKKLVLSVKKL